MLGQINDWFRNLFSDHNNCISIDFHNVVVSECQQTINDLTKMNSILISRRDSDLSFIEFLKDDRILLMTRLGLISRKAEDSKQTEFKSVASVKGWSGIKNKLETASAIKKHELDNEIANIEASIANGNLGGSQ